MRTIFIFTLPLFDGVVVSTGAAVQFQNFVDGFSSTEVALADVTEIDLYLFDKFFARDAIFQRRTSISIT